MLNKKKVTITLTLVPLTLSLFIILTLFNTGFALAADDIQIDNYRGNLKITNPNGGFFIGNISGKCELRANGGPLKIGIVTGDLSATTSAGDIEIIEAKGNVNVVTRAGNILIKKAFKHVYAETVLGEINIHYAKSVEVKNIVGGDVKLYYISGCSNVTTSGNILLVVSEKISGFNVCDLRSIEGDITIYLPKNFGADIEIRTPISRDDPAKETRIESDFNFSVLNQRYEDAQFLNITTRINGGGRKIKLFINKGNIYLKALKSEKHS
jgi:DUF4097 and DUF4098 domain-containing protein YvlB